VEYLVITLKQATVLDCIESIAWICVAVVFIVVLIKMYKRFKKLAETEAYLKKKEGK
jgi:uncharacterized protein YoxC